MKFGVYLPHFGPWGNVRLLADMAVDAEEAGWDGFFLWDHIAGWINPNVDVTVTLAAIATLTRRIRFGALVTPLPRRRPWKFARETASLDQLSGGRLIIGVGTGGSKKEFDDLGEEIDARKRGAMLDESLDILCGLWRGEAFSYEGDYYQVREATFDPTPVQQPRIPIWVGGIWPNKIPFRRALRYDGYMPLIRGGSEAELAALEEINTLRQAHSPAGDPGDLIYQGESLFGQEPEQVAEMVARYATVGVTWWLEHIAPYRFGKGFYKEWDTAALRALIRQGPSAHK